MRFINKLVEDFSEAISGAAQPAELEQLSSSIPTVALAVSPAVVLLISKVVDKFLDSWMKIEKIRKLRAEIAEMGLKGTALNEFTEQIETTIEEVVEESTELVPTNYSGDHGRKSELKNAIRQDTKRLFGQIERGLAIEFQVRKDENDNNEEKQKILENIEAVTKRMKFPEITKEPMLLGSGELLEGDIAIKHSRKTTTHKTTAKKGTKEAAAAESKV